MNEVTSPYQMDSQYFTRCAWCSLMFGPESGPQLLPCLHTLCVRCFAVSEKITECPVCQEKYDPSEVISNLLLMKHHINLCESNKCSSCDDPSVSAWCVACQENLCAVCVAAHKTAEDTRGHYVHTVTPEYLRPAMCLIHKQEVISSFCLMCDQLTCRKCPALHPGHLLQLSHEAVGKQRKQIRQMFQKVQQKSPSVQKSLNDLQGRLSDLEALRAQLRLDVKNTVSRLCSMVLKKGSKLLRDIEDVCRSEKERIDGRRRILERLKGKQDHVLTFTHKVLDSNDHTVLLSCKKQIHHQLKDLLEQPAFPMSTMMELYFHSNESNAKKVLKAFGCIEAREVPFTCSEPGTVPNQLLTPNVQKTPPPSSTRQDSLPSVTLPPTGSKKCNKDNPKGLACSPKSSICTSQYNKYPAWPRSKHLWSFQPYQPRRSLQLPQPSSKPVSDKDNKGSLVAPLQLNIPHTSTCEPSGTGPSQAEPGSHSTPLGKTPGQAIPVFEKVASDTAYTRRHKDGGLVRDQPVHTLGCSPETVSTDIQRVDSDLKAPPTGSAEEKQEMKLPDPSVQPLNLNPDQSGLPTSKELKITRNLSYKTSDLLNPNVAVKNPITQGRAVTLNPSQSGNERRTNEANSSPPQNLSTAQLSLNKNTATLQEVKPLEETLHVSASENSQQRPPEHLLECEKEETDTPTLIKSGELKGLKVEPAQESTQRVSVKEQPEVGAITEPLSSHRPGKEEEDEEEEDPVMKIRDEGNVVVLEPLGRDWLPRISLCRFSVRDYPSFCPPAFCVVQREPRDGFELGVIQDDGQSVVPRCLSHPLLVKKRHCAACRISGQLFQCCVCQRAFHRECHLPLISLTKTDQWQCVLCRDFSHTGDRDVDPQSAASPCLSLYEQRKCEYLLLSLSCHKHSSTLYRSATPSSHHYVDVTLVRGRLLGKIRPPYRTPAEFVSDLWLLLNTLHNSSKKMLHVEHLQRFFSKQLHSVFGTDLQPSLLTDPYGGENAEERRKRARTLRHPK